MKTEVKRWLEGGEVEVFLGYKLVEGHPLPHFFTGDRLEELDDLVPGPVRYPLEKMAAMIASERPGVTIGLLARECTRRSLNILFMFNQLDPDRVRTVPVNCCASERRGRADCSYLCPEKRGSYKRRVGIDNSMDIETVEQYFPGERFRRWMAEFEKCLKCYGCRNICPVCFCKACSLASPELVQTGDLPPEVPLFHLIRAVHMAGRCIDCGLCEEACPADIPLRLLYRKVNEIVGKVFDYEAGTSPGPSPFHVLGEEVTLEPRPIGEAGPCGL